MAKKSKTWIALLGLGSLVALLARKAGASEVTSIHVVPPAPGEVTVNEEHKYAAPMKLSSNFDLSEFLRSDVMPQLATYKLTQTELDNLKSLVVGILQPMRDKFGPITITSGGRPLDFKVDGKTIDDLMTSKGMKPAIYSDHHSFLAADFVPANPSLYEPIFVWLQTLPLSRQVILYHTPEGAPTHLHVGITSAFKPKLIAPYYAFRTLETGTGLA